LTAGDQELPVVGQRWVSETEPDLGLGLVVAVSARRVVMEFRACEERREYALGTAPLRRAVLQPGDVAATRDGREMEVAEVRLVDGVVWYRTTSGDDLFEGDLGDALSISAPERRIEAGHADPARLFDLRCRALALEHRRRASPARGFLGARIDLIPHQLFIASEVTGRHAPRVLLADEVGLGKAIEAGLIIHRLLQTERVRRVLIVVPEALVLQWFVELLRRFDLHPVVVGLQWRVERGGSRDNPFADEPLVLCPMAVLADAEQARQAVEAGWDLLVVDEAHRLSWSASGPSREYQVVEALSRRVPAVLLLTATPEQLGLAGHFARLRLLDPARYSDPRELEDASQRYRPTADLVEALSSESPLAPHHLESLAVVLAGEPAASRDRLVALARADRASRRQVVQALIDRHGTGRAVFRNTRLAIGGFPARRVSLTPLAITHAAPDRLAAAVREIPGEVSPGAEEESGDLRGDPRVVWLAQLLRQTEGAKVLLICRTPAMVRAIDAALRHHLRVSVALFHEGLELVQRDRQAAWFSEPDGAQVLLASELGSEGRNFQFAHHLVLFDLPLDPELLEQRIGRLDRIGQKETIDIHVPFVPDTPQEVWARWYHEGLDAFDHPVRCGRAMAEMFGERLVAVGAAFARREAGRETALADLITETREARLRHEAQLAGSRDLLLELGSFRPEPASRLASEILAIDADPALESLMLDLWSHFMVSVEDLAPRTYLVGAEAGRAEVFPGLPARGLAVTFDRARAVVREDLTFLTWDHPMVTGALDLFLGGRDGNAAGSIVSDGDQAGTWLEAVHVLECVASPALHIDRFLAPVALRRVVGPDGEDVTERADAALTRAGRAGDASGALVPPDRSRLRAMVAQARRAAEAERAQRVAEAEVRMRALLDQEIERLRSLAAVNPAVRPQEIEALEREKAALTKAISSARLRLDALRLIVLARG